MQKLKPILIYMLALVGLVVMSLLFTGPVDPELEPLPTSTATAQPTPTSEPDPQDCRATPQNTGVRPDFGEVPFTNQLAPPEVPGERIIVSGTVYAKDEQTRLAGALLEVWQADSKGRYNVENNLLRAKLKTNEAGRYQFSTIMPGPVQVGCQYLPAHINYLVSYNNSRPLFMMQFFANDPYLANHPQMRRQALTRLVWEKDPEDPFWHARFDIVLPITPDER